MDFNINSMRRIDNAIQVLSNLAHNNRCMFLDQDFDAAAAIVCRHRTLNKTCAGSGDIMADRIMSGSKRNWIKCKLLIM